MKIGSQEPRIKIEPHRVSSDGPDAAVLMAAYSSPLDKWQQTVLDCWLGKDEEGQYTVTSAGLECPRQNGKNYCIEARETYGLLVNAEKILHTAHQVKTSKKSFRRLVAIFTDKRHPEIMAEVKNIRYTNGEECIELWNGGTIEFSTRSRQAARGFDGISLIIYDEAQELTDEQIDATMATLAASKTGQRQIIYTGTPPYPGCPGKVFRRKRNESISNPSSGEAWHEWSVEAESLDQIDVNDIELWYKTNPALGIHLTEEFTRTESRDMAPDGFARERLGWWMPELATEDNKAIDEEAWKKCASDKLKPQGKTAYGVQFSADGTEVCLAGAVIPRKGEARISFIERKPTGRGTRWLSDWLNDRYGNASCVVIDGRNGVDVVIDRLSDTWKAKDSIIKPNAKQVISSVSLLTEMINEQTVTWYRKQEALNESALSSTKRPFSGGYGFGGDDSAPIKACALALWGAKTSKRDPNRKQRIE